MATVAQLLIKIGADTSELKKTAQFYKEANTLDVWQRFPKSIQPSGSCYRRYWRCDSCSRRKGR